MTLSFGNDPTLYLLLIVGALFVNACYQLSVSVLTYLTSHSLSRRTSVKRLLWLGSSYTLGVIIATSLVLLFVVSLTTIGGQSLHSETLHIFSLAVIVVVPVIGLATMAFYYRHGNGTKLWLPRPVASYLTERARRTKSGFEATLLGAGTVVGELPFIVAPLALVALVLADQPTSSWAGWSLAYGILASLPLVAIVFYLTSGHSIARLQRWREQSKTFLQWTSGIALVLLTIYAVLGQLGVLS